MARCEVCGNDYYLSFQVIAAGQTHTFDSFECAAHKLAPVCDHCGCKILGHGMEAGTQCQNHPTGGACHQASHRHSTLLCMLARLPCARGQYGVEPSIAM